MFEVALGKTRGDVIEDCPTWVVGEEPPEILHLDKGVDVLPPHDMAYACRLGANHPATRESPDMSKRHAHKVSSPNLRSITKLIVPEVPCLTYCHKQEQRVHT